MHNYTVGFVFSGCRERVLLLKKQEPPQHNNKLNGIGGKIEDETPLANIERECREETGLHINTWRLIERGVAHDGNALFVYAALCPTGQLVVCGDVGLAHWYNTSSLPLNVLPDVPRLIGVALTQARYLTK